MNINTDNKLNNLTKRYVNLLWFAPRHVVAPHSEDPAGAAFFWACLPALGDVVPTLPFLPSLVEGVSLVHFWVFPVVHAFPSLQAITCMGINWYRWAVEKRISVHARGCTKTACSKVIFFFLITLHSKLFRFGFLIVFCCCCFSWKIKTDIIIIIRERISWVPHLLHKVGAPDALQ